MASETDYVQLDLELNENNLQQGASAVLRYIRPEWDIVNVKFKIFTDGISNKLIGAWHEDDERNMVLVRIFGKKTELIVDRAQERRVFQVIHKAGLGPELYATFKNGISYGYMPGRILSTESVRSDKLYPIIAREMARLHVQKPTEGFSLEPSVFATIRKWIRTIRTMPVNFTDPEKKDRYTKEVPSLETLEDELNQLEKALIALNSPVVFSHNDLLIANIVHDEQENRIYFIDYEFASYNFQGYDIGNHFNEYAGVDDIDYSLYPDKEHQLKWLNEYLKAWHEFNDIAEPVTDIEVERLYVIANKFSLVSHLFCGTWGLLQSRLSDIDFDFLGYSITRLGEYFKNRDKFLALEMPNVTS